MVDNRPKHNCPTCGLRVQTTFEHVDAKTCPVGIVSVAIKQNRKIYSMGAPMRHMDLIRSMGRKGVALEEGAINGFKLADGKFADRATARNIAIRAGQVKNTIDLINLSSEDLW